MKKLIIVGALCVLASYLYATPSLGSNTYMQLQSEGSFFATQTGFESYVPFQSTNADVNAALFSARRTRNAGIITTSVGLALGIVGGILVGLGLSQTATYDIATQTLVAPDPDVGLAISGYSLASIGSLLLTGGAIAWGVGASQMRSAMLHQ